MLLRIFILFVVSSQFLFSQENFLDKKISVSLNDLELYKALSIFQDMSDINFAFNNNLEGMNERVSGKFENVPIKDVLNILLSLAHT